MTKMKEVSNSLFRFDGGYVTDDGHTVTTINGADNSRYLEPARELADKIGKDIIIMSSGVKKFSGLIKKHFNLSDVFAHTLIISTSPRDVDGSESAPLPSQMSEASRSMSSMCYGKQVSSLSILNESTKTIDDIRNDESLSESEMEDKIRIAESRPAMSVYSKYDAVFKDTCTNIVWALRDRCIVYMMFPMTIVNRQVLSVCMKELSRRIEGKISLKDLVEIDKNYHEGIALENKQEYVSFAVKSASKLKDEINGLKNEAETSYKRALEQAMEQGKMLKKYQDQLDVFDSSNYAEKEKEKSMLQYQEALDIPEVLSIDIRDSSIHIYTRNIYVQDDRSKKWHDIGTFHISLGMLSNDYNTGKTVKIMNTKHQIHSAGSMQAPHVFNDGHMCHGNLTTGIVECYKNRDLYEMAYLLIRYLSSVNTNDSAGKGISSWPEVSEEVALGQIVIEGETQNEEPSDAEKQFDDMLGDAIPV